MSSQELSGDGCFTWAPSSPSPSANNDALAALFDRNERRVTGINVLRLIQQERRREIMESDKPGRAVPMDRDCPTLMPRESPGAIPSIRAGLRGKAGTRRRPVREVL